MSVDTSPRATIYGNESVRRYPRALFSIPVKLRHLVAGGIQTSRGITLDISEGGLGALVQGGLRLGETVEIDLQFAERPLSAVAIVRHTSQIRSGFEFLGLTAQERGQISTVCTRKQITRQAHQ